MPATSLLASARPGFTRRHLITAGALTIAAMSARPTPEPAEPNDAISRTEEAIHQVRVFAAGRNRVYEALTVETQFDKVVQLSGVMKADAMAQMPNELVVQAWRVLSWPRGVHSIARFELLA